MNIIDEELRYLIKDNFCSGNNNKFTNYNGNISYFLDKKFFNLKRNRVHYFTCENGNFTIDKNGVINWISGNWLDGIFFGNFLGGVWYNGIFKWGTFQNSVWKNGTFENGTFVNSLWVSGNMKNGQFINSKSENNNYGIEQKP